MIIKAAGLPGMWVTSNDIFRDIAPALEKSDIPVELMDLNRDNIMQVTFDDYLEQYQKFIDKIEADKIVICGVSMGGLAAQRVKNERIAGRILLGPAAPKEVVGPFGIFNCTNPTQFFSLIGQLNQPFNGGVRPTPWWAKRVLFNDPRRTEIPDITKRPKESYWVFDRIFRGVSASRQHKVTVIAGAQDMIVTPKIAKKIAEYHYNASIKIFPGDHESICHDPEVIDFIVQRANFYFRSHDQNRGSIQRREAVLV